MLKRLFFFMFLMVSFTRPVWAQSAIQVRENQVSSDYPFNITFQLQVDSNSPIERIDLMYGTNARGCAESLARQALEIQPAQEQTMEWTWDFFKSGSLPPGAEVWWQWEIQDASGASLTTEKQTLLVEDPHFDWQTLEKENVLVYWVEGGRGFGTMVMNKALASLERLAEDAGVRPLGEIRLTIYPNTRTLRHAGLYIPDWAGGVAFPEYGSILIGIPPGATRWANEVVPHELAHLVTDELVFNCMGVGLPTWLSEGLAVYSEAYVAKNDIEKLNEALQAGSLPALRSLSAGFSGDQDRIVLDYIQSGQVVYYLVETHGAEKLTALLSAIREGNSIDHALRQVYGFDTDGLDHAWRASLGFEPSTQAVGTPEPLSQPTPVPTLALWTPAYVPPTATLAPSPTSFPTIEAILQTIEPTDMHEGTSDEAGNGTWLWLLLAGLGGALALLLFLFIVWMFFRSARS